MRVDRDKFYMNLAHLYADRSTCDRAKVGAIVTTNGRLVAAGYNGAPSGEEHCDDVGHRIVDNHCVRVTHAEVNAFGFLHQIHPYRLKDVVLYVTHLPCFRCIDYMTYCMHKPREVVYDIAYGDNIEERIKKLEEAGIHVRKL